MANSQHLATLKRGVERWNTWRERHPKVSPHLSGAGLKGAELARAKLHGADLIRANLGAAELRGANLNTACLREASLIDANLRGAYFYMADLRGADLRGANLRQADLEGANLTGADLNGANLTEARFGDTTIADVDLSTVNGLETVHHRGPSGIGIDTIYKSNAKIPELFLRGCGVSDSFIEYMRSLVVSPIEFYSCFISYSTKDQEFADRLYADLQSKSVRCWFAAHDIQGGRKIHEQIDIAIRVHDKLLLILSEYSMNSKWVKTEIANAREREDREKRQMLFPITLVPFEKVKAWKLFDADRGVDSAREVREYFIPDFSNWKDHDSYRKAFDRLIKDLKQARDSSDTGTAAAFCV